MYLLIPRELRYITRFKPSEVEPSGSAFQSTIATMPTQLSAQVLQKYGSSAFNNVSTSITLPRAVVGAKCGIADHSDLLVANSSVAYIKDSGARDTLCKFWELIQQYVDEGGSDDTAVNSLPPIWRSSPEVGSNSYVVNFVKDFCAANDQATYPVSFLISDMMNLTTRVCPSSITCTVVAYWESSEHDLIGSNGLATVRSAPISQVGFAEPGTNRRISVDWKSIALLNTVNFTNIIRDPILDAGSVTLAASLATVFSEILWEDEVFHDYYPVLETEEKVSTLR